jgi:hypothetical protein
MSYVKFTPDLFIGQQELNRFQSFIQEKFNAITKTETLSWGLLKNGSDAIGNNFLVENGTTAGTIKIATESYALDSDVNLIKKRIEDYMPIPTGGIWYWLMIEHSTTNKEQGTVGVDVSGSLVGVGTKFTEVLRGLPDFPSVVSFPNSTLNTGKYQVVSVIDDLNVILSGTFVAESNLSIVVVGTFTPGVVIADINKYPFNYDSCTLSLEPELVTNTPPAKNTGTQFYIARVKNDAGTLTIQDKRTEFWITKRG